MFSKLKQIKDLRDKGKQLQSQLAGITAEGSSAWGKVKITMDGNQKVLSVSIDPEFLKPESKTKLEEAVKESFEDAIKKIQKAMMSKAGSLKEMLNIPGL